MFTIVREWTLLIYEVSGLRSRSEWTHKEISCEPNTDLSVLCFLIKLSRHVYHGESYFGCQSSNEKVTMGIIDKCGVRGDATLCVVIFLLRLEKNKMC